MEHVQYTPRARSQPVAGRPSSGTSLMRSSARVGRHLCLRWLARRHRFCGTSWSRSSSPSYPCRLSTFLCRRWWTILRKSSSFSSRCLLLLSRLSNRPRSLLRTPSRSEHRSGNRSWWSSWWKCRLSCLLPSCRSWCCHGIGPQMAARGATAQGPGVSTGGSPVRDTLSGDPQRVSPPARAGKQTLDKAEASTRVVDVPVLMQLLFLQSMEHVIMKVPQIQFIVRRCEYSVVPQRRVSTVQAVQKIVEFHRAVLGTVVDAPVVGYDRCLAVQTMQRTVLVPQLQFIDVGSIRCEHAGTSSSSFQRERLSWLFFCPFPKGIFRTPSTRTLSPGFQRTF